MEGDGYDEQAIEEMWQRLELQNDRQTLLVPTSERRHSHSQSGRLSRFFGQGPLRRALLSSPVSSPVSARASARVTPRDTSVPGSPATSVSTPRPSWASYLRIKVGTLGIIAGVAVGVTQLCRLVFFSGPNPLTVGAQVFLVCFFFGIVVALYMLIKVMQCEE